MFKMGIGQSGNDTVKSRGKIGIYVSPVRRFDMILICVPA